MTQQREKPPGKIITFYSYKGGTGRSMALANFSWILASAGKRVLVLDWDLEAPGLQRYYRPFLIDKDLTDSKGVIDYVTDFAAAAITPRDGDERSPEEWLEEQTDLLNYTVSLNWNFPGKGSIDFIPAGQQGPTYTARFTDFNWQKFYDRLGGGAFLEAARRRMREEYDYILIDSRTGVSDTAGICTVQMPDMLVVCFTYNNQSIDGAAAVARSVCERRARLEREDEYRFRVVPIPMRADPFESEKLKRRKRFARWRFNQSLNGEALSDLRTLWGEIEVPYIPYYAYEELLATFRDDPDEVNSMLGAMVRLTNRLTESDVGEFRLTGEPELRGQVLQEFAELPEGVGEVVVAPTPVEGEADAEKFRRLGDAAFADLSEEEQAQAPRLWTRLVRVPRRRESAPLTRLRVEQDDIPQAARPLIPRFKDVLLTDRDKDTSAKTVEAVSEEFLRTWPRLTDWVALDRDFLIWRQNIHEYVVEWKSDPKAGDRYLLIGRDLTEAEHWAKERPADLNEHELEYIQVSRSRWRKRLRLYTAIGAASVVAALVLFVGLSVWKDWRRRDEAAANLAVEAAKQSQSVENLQLSTLLALEALKISKTKDSVRRVLLENLRRLPRREAQVAFNRDIARVALRASDPQLILTAVSAPPTGPTMAGGAFPSPATAGSLTVQVQEARTGRSIAQTQVSRFYKLSPDGHYLATLADNGRRATNQSAPDGFPVRLEEIGDLTRTPIMLPRAGEDAQMFFSPDGRYFGSVGADDIVRVVDMAAWKAPGELEHPGVFTFAFGPNGQRLATLNADKHLHIWDNATLKERPIVPPIQGEGLLRAFCDAGDGLIAMVVGGTTVNIVSAKNGALIDSLSPDDGEVFNATFTRDGAYLITTSLNGSVKAWDLNRKPGQSQNAEASGNAVVRYETLRLKADSPRVIFSPDGLYVAGLDGQTVLRLWDVSKGFGSEAAFVIDEARVRDAAFSQDGKYIVTVNRNNVARVWQVSGAQALDENNLEDEACARLTRNLTEKEFRDVFRNDEPYHKTCQEFP